MIYTIEKATLLTNQINRFTTSYIHHLVGQFANLDFWLDEIEHALNTIEGYNKHFKNMSHAQKKWVKNHGTRVFGYCAICGGKCEFDDGTPSPPRRLSSNERELAYRNLSDASYEFLLRCYRAGFLDKTSLEKMCLRVGTSLELSDLER